MAISHQLVFVLQSVLEQGPYDGLQLRVRGQQVRAEHFQPGVGQPVHCGREAGRGTALVTSKELSFKELENNVQEAIGVLHFL